MHGVPLQMLLLSHMARSLSRGARQREQPPTAGQVDKLRIREFAGPLTRWPQIVNLWLTVEPRSWFLAVNVTRS